MESWILILALVLLGALYFRTRVNTARDVARNADAAPFLALLGARKNGQEKLSPQAIAFALRRCAFCAGGEACRQKVAANLPLPDTCPNASFLARSRDLRSA